MIELKMKLSFHLDKRERDRKRQKDNEMKRSIALFLLLSTNDTFSRGDKKIEAGTKFLE